MSSHDPTPSDMDEQIRSRLQTFARHVAQHADTEAALQRLPRRSLPASARRLAIAACLLPAIAVAAALIADRHRAETVHASDPPAENTDGATEVSEPDLSQSATSESDAQLIMGLWAYLEQASEGGLDAWGQAVVDSQYPGFGATFEVCTHGVSSGERFRVAYEAERSSIRSEPEWTVPDFSPGSPMSGQTPVGRTYSVSVRASFAGSPEVHEDVQYVTVRNGEAFWFPICESD